MQDATKLNFDLSVALNAASGPVGIIRAQGADAAKFLQGQLTQDVALLGLSECRLSAWCSAKGRMLASFVLFKNAHDDIMLMCTASVLPSTLKRLQMFVMRAQCKLSDATALFEVRGLAGSLASNITSLAPWTLKRDGRDRPDGEVITLQLPPGHHAGQAVPRAVQVTPLAQDAELASHDEGLSLWQYLNVTSGIAHITTPVSELFVPQMLNYESVGGVNFKKGCYPGQEVVARSQFRGTLKRRAYIASCDAPMAAGQEVFDSRDALQPCGTVASAAVQPGKASFLAIVSMQTSAVDSPRLSLGAADGSALVLQALPYALLEDI